MQRPFSSSERVKLFLCLPTLPLSAKICAPCSPGKDNHAQSSLFRACLPVAPRTLCLEPSSSLSLFLRQMICFPTLYFHPLYLLRVDSQCFIHLDLNGALRQPRFSVRPPKFMPICVALMPPDVSHDPKTGFIKPPVICQVTSFPEFFREKKSSVF